MLEIKDQGYLDEVKAFAESIGLLEQLQQKLDYLDAYGSFEGGSIVRCVLERFIATPYSTTTNSFSFVMMKQDKAGEYQPWFNGGLIFHGAPTGYSSEDLRPIDGWSIHT